MTSARSERTTPLLPREVRWPAAVLVLCCTGVLVALAVRYHGDHTAGRVDDWVFGQTLLHSHRKVGQWLAEALPLVMILIAAVLAVVCGLRHRWRFAVLAVLAPSVTIALTETAKHVVDRRIDHYLALPSGHTAGSTSVFLVVGLVVLSRVRRNVRAAAALVLAAVTAGAALVGLLMVSLHDHYATDTVAGYCIALAVTLTLALALDGPRRRSLEPTRSTEAPALMGG